ncbi:hypothetical protein LT966_21775 [Streptomyces griseobrunneus]|uniref:Uncharacterized protein n=1 Tax=Streptomyces bacillaris TaxID=68179 RepID=A0ABW6DPZ6_9ACTN|nr:MULTISPECIES: hypothetical protein [Streptomyces]GGS41612.1 hypothetical protein GCM10010221_45570 [Streptomyces parvus]
MNEYPYLPAECRNNRCDHEPNRCVRYRSRRCLSGECTHARQDLICAVNYPTGGDQQ